MDLSPEIIKMRDALLERIEDKSLKEAGEIVNEIMLNETNQINRLAALAARVSVLRKNINKNFNISKPKKTNLKKETILKNLTDNQESINEKDKNEDEKDSWTRVEMLKSGIVNGVRFPEGVVIDVNKNDAEKLVKDGLSKIIEEKNEESIENSLKTNNSTKEVKPLDVPEEKVKGSDISEAITEKATSADTKTADVPEEEVKGPDINEAITEKATVLDAEKEDLVKKKVETGTNEMADKKILKTKSTKITEETIELTDSKAVAEALGLNEAKKKAEEPKEIEEVLDIEELETGKKRK